MITVKNPGVYIFIFFAAIYAFFSIGHFGGDGYQDYLTAESIVLDGNISIYDRPGDPDELDYIKDTGVSGIGGKTYSSRNAIGMPVLLAPFYFMGDLIARFAAGAPHDYVTMLAVSFFNPVASAIACLLVFAIARRMSFAPGISAALSFIYGLSTMAPVYSRTGFAAPAATMFLLLAVYMFFKYRDSFKMVNIFLSGFFLACMFLCRIPVIVMVPCFAVVLLWVLKDADLPVVSKYGHFLGFAGILTCVLAGLLFFNFHIYGSVNAFGGVDASVIGKRIAGAPHMLKGLYYYLLSPGKSLFLYNIPVIFGFLALRRAFKADQKTAVLFLLVFAVNLLLYVKSFRRGSLFSWGPRYLLPSVPLLILFAGYYLENMKSSMQEAAVILVSIAGFFIMLPCMLINQSRFYFFIVEKLGLDEYMINFIPDLSPIKGAWAMLINRISLGINGEMPLYVYAPDYRLVAPVSASMEQYNYLDIWFLKVIETAPAYAPLVYCTLFVLAGIAVFSAYKIIRIR